MGLNKQKSFYPINDPNRNSNSNIELSHIQNILNELGSVINTHGEGLKRSLNKLNEAAFRLGKMDEQLQIQRNDIRKQRDKLNVFFKTLVELGVVDDTAFNVAYSINESKMLPITQDGKINASIGLTRFNHPEGIPEITDNV